METLYFLEETEISILQNVYESNEIYKKRILLFEKLFFEDNLDKNRSLAISTAYMNNLIYGVIYNEEIMKKFI